MKRFSGLAVAAALATGVSGCAAIRDRAGAAGTPVAATPRPPPPTPAPAPANDSKVVRVIVPKAVKCVPDEVGPPPPYPDSDAALRQAGGAADRYQLMAAGRILRQERLQKLEDAVKRCRSLGR
jgi:hypothetical protein